MIGSLTTAFAWLLGKATEIAGKHRMFQADAVSHTTVLSAVFIEVRVFRNWRLRLVVQHLLSAIDQLFLLIQGYAYAPINR